MEGSGWEKKQTGKRGTWEQFLSGALTSDECDKMVIMLWCDALLQVCSDQCFLTNKFEASFQSIRAVNKQNFVFRPACSLKVWPL